MNYLYNGESTTASVSDEAAAYPTMAPSHTWYKGNTKRKDITEINFVKRYASTGNESESWAADVEDSGAIMCYVTGKVLTISSNGAEKILANEDSGYMFSWTNPVQDCFGRVSAINGLAMLDTRNVVNMYCMFESCMSVTRIDVTHFDTSKVTNMGEMFGACMSATHIDVTRFDTSKVTNMIKMFSCCRSLTRLDLSNFDTGNVTSMQMMFNGCVALMSLDLSNFDTGNVTTMYGMFFNSNGLTSIDMSNWITRNVTDMDGMFYSCSNLYFLDLTSFDTNKVEYMGSMFRRCSALKVIYVGPGWSKHKFKRADKVFNHCGVTTLTYVKEVQHDG